MNNSKLQSSVIDFLRFPLIVGVLFIHNYDSIVSIQGKKFGNSENLNIYNVIKTVFSEILGHTAVPLFFFISGFLFFLNVGNFNKSIYFKKLKGRLNTLLIPYLFWNIALLVLLFLISLAPSLSSFLNKKPELSINYLLHALWNGNSGYPISYQFWFIRDLMVMVLLTPLVYLYVKYLKSLGLFLLGIFWFCNYWFHVPGLSIAAIFLFTAGAWFSINAKSLLIESKQISTSIFITYPILIAIDFITNKTNYNLFIHNAGIIIGLLFWFSLVQKLLENNVVKLNNFIVQSSFFIFAFHEPLLTIIKKIAFAAIKPEKEATLIFLYFAIIAIVIIISLTLYYFLRLLLPKFCQIITGGR